jgi:mannose/fructose-specific phosphotransferase system component IIA
MIDELQGVVIGHGGLATALVTAAEEITGVHGALVGISNRGCDRGRLEERIREAIGGRPSVIFVDLQSGSCFFAAMSSLKAMPDLRVVTGVNLPMLVDFVFHRATGLEEAVTRARAVGEKAIEGTR